MKHEKTTLVCCVDCAAEQRVPADERPSRFYCERCAAARLAWAIAVKRGFADARRASKEAA